MATQLRVLTAPTFGRDGILYPAGAAIPIDVDALGGVREPDTLYAGDPGNLSNLAPVGTRATASGPVSTTEEVLPGMTADERSEMADLRAQIAAMQDLMTKMQGPVSEGIEEEPAQSALSAFSATEIVNANVPDVVAKLNGLTKEQLQQIRDAEVAGQNRAGVLGPVDTALAA